MKRLISIFLSTLLLLSIAFPLALADGGPKEEVPQTAGEPEGKIVLTGGDTVRWTCGIPYEDPGFQAFDREGREVKESSVRVRGKVREWRPGEYEVHYSFRDGEETVEAVRRVVIDAAELPETVHQDRAIYLTFDDGPSRYTEQVLDILKKYDVKATFFIVAGKAGYRDILPRIVEEGHTIGIHCYDHGYNLIYASEENFFRDFLEAQKIVYEYTGTYASVSRFPGSSRTASMLSNQYRHGLSDLMELMHGMGVRCYDWSIQTETGKTSHDIAWFFTHPKKDYDGDISLQHDTRSNSVLALERMIQWGLKEGYTFLPIDTTTPEILFELK